MVTSRFITPPTQTNLSASLIAKMQERLVDWLADEADPGVYWSDLTAAEFLDYIGQFNDGAEAAWIMTAKGQDLRDLLRNVNIEITDLTIPDDELRQLYFDAWTALDKDTDEYALLLARRADSRVSDAALSFNAGANQITMYIADTNGQDLGAAIRTAVQTYMQDPGRHPIWLDYVVDATTVTAYSVDATITYRRGRPSPELAARAALTETLMRLRKLNTGIYISALEAGLRVEDVVNVVVSDPAADLARAAGTVYHGTIGTLTFAEEA